MDHLVGTAEIGEMLGVTRQRVAQIVASYSDFPSPEAELSAGRIWTRRSVETWIASHPERRPGRSGGPELRFERWSQEARQVLLYAQEEARELRHGYLGCEHFLLGLTRIGSSKRVLERLGASHEEIRKWTLEVVGPGKHKGADTLPWTPRAREAAQLAQEEALEQGRAQVEAEHLFIGILLQAENVACLVLASHGIDLEKLRGSVSQAEVTIKARTESRHSLSPESEAVPDPVLAQLDRIETRLERLERLLEEPRDKTSRPKPARRSSMTKVTT